MASSAWIVMPSNDPLKVIKSQFLIGKPAESMVDFQGNQVDQRVNCIATTKPGHLITAGYFMHFSNEVYPQVRCTQTTRLSADIFIVAYFLIFSDLIMQSHYPPTCKQLYRPTYRITVISVYRDVQITKHTYQKILAAYNEHPCIHIPAVNPITPHAAGTMGHRSS